MYIFLKNANQNGKKNQDSWDIQAFPCIKNKYI